MAPVEVLFKDPGPVGLPEMLTVALVSQCQSFSQQVV